MIFKYLYATLPLISMILMVYFYKLLFYLCGWPVDSESTYELTLFLTLITGWIPGVVLAVMIDGDYS